MLVTASQRYDLPLVIASSHSAAWEHHSVRSLVEVCGLKLSTHRWCAFGLKTSGGNPSAVTHRCASTFEWQSMPCQCEPDAEHMHDLALRDPCCTAQRRHAYEVEAVMSLLGSAWICESVSGKAADSTRVPGKVALRDSNRQGWSSDIQTLYTSTTRQVLTCPELQSQKILSLTVQRTASNPRHNFCSIFYGPMLPSACPKRNCLV